MIMLSSNTVSKFENTVPRGTDLFVAGDHTGIELNNSILLRSLSVKEIFIGKDLSPSLNAPIVVPVVAARID